MFIIAAHSTSSQSLPQQCASARGYSLKYRQDFGTVRTSEPRYRTEDKPSAGFWNLPVDGFMHRLSRARGGEPAADHDLVAMHRPFEHGNTAYAENSTEQRAVGGRKANPIKSTGAAGWLM